MLDILNNNITYISLLALVLIIGFYYLMMWQIKVILKHELKRLYSKRKHKKLEQNKKYKMIQNPQNNPTNNTNENNNSIMDADSYVDPAEYQTQQNSDNTKTYEENDDEYDKSIMIYDDNRLKTNDILMRDITDGTR